MGFLAAVAADVDRFGFHFLVPNDELVRDFLGLAGPNLVLHLFVALVHISTDALVLEGFGYFPSVVDVRTESVQRCTAFLEHFASGHFSSAYTSSDLNLDAFGANPHG